MYMSRLTVALAACTMDVSSICQEVPSNKAKAAQMNSLIIQRQLVMQAVNRC